MNTRQETKMTPRFTARVESIGIITRGAQTYWVQRHYPHGGSNYRVYVFYKGALEKRGIVFRNEDEFFEWVERVPAQRELWD